jgi:long-chain fatty acid transport protein
MKSNAAAIAIAIFAIEGTAYAGGFEVPDNGTEALGRGGAFVAKADDGTALYHNIAGLARQRGTRLLINGNLTLDNYEFQRAGVYPDSATNPKTPWGGAFFPRVANEGGPFFAPFLAASSDFNTFDRLTFAVGVFGPSGVGNRTYPVGVGGAPSPARYDVVQARTLVVLPTIAAAYRLSDDIEIGAAFHYVIGSFDLINVSSTDISRALCPNPEFVGCDSQTRVTTSGSSVAASFGAMVHPSDWLAIGANVRTPISLDTSGTVESTTPPAISTQPPSPGTATFSTKLPLVARVGARVIFHDGAFEAGDLELDGTWENWSDAQGKGPTIDIPQVSIFKDVHTTIAHGYGDTYSVRLGGQYNTHALGGILSLRAGGYYDSSATTTATTRIDFNTLEKYAATLGIGLKLGPLKVNVAYAEIFSPERVVTNGTLRPINGSQHGQPVDGNGQPLGVVNNGVYDSHMRIISAGIEVVFDEVFGSERYRRLTHGERAPEPKVAPPEEKPADEKPAEAKPAAEEKKEEKPIVEKKAAPAPPKKKRVSDWDS